MKKLFLLFVAISAIFCLVGCKDKMEAPKAGDPVLKNIDFKSYDAFAVMRESNGAKGLSDGISSNLNCLFGLADNALEKITLADEKGLEWACNEVKNIGNDFLLMGLSYAGEAETQFRNYCIDRMSGKVIDLSFLVGSRPVDMKEIGLQSTSEGLFAKKDATAVKIDPDAKTLTPLTNSETDPIRGFYKFDNGVMVVATDDGAGKFYPAGGGIPITYASDSDIAYTIRSAGSRWAIGCLVSPDTDFMVNLYLKKIVHMAPKGLTDEYLPDDKGGGEYKGGWLYYDTAIFLYPLEDTLDRTKVICYHRTLGGLVTIHDISTGELVYTQYLAPPDLTGTMGYDNGIFYYSTNAGIYALELETQVTAPVFEGSVSSWKLAPGGLIYTKYLSATDTQTCFYSFGTKETEVLSSSGVEVVSIASFVE